LTASRDRPVITTIMVRGPLQQQVRAAYAKIEAILAAADLTLADVVRVVEYVKVAVVDDYQEIARVRQEVLGEARPAVSTVCVSALLWPEAVLEIEVLAGKGAPGDPLDGVVYLPSLTAPEAGDLVGQAEAVYEKASALLAGMRLTLCSVVKTVDYCPATALSEYRHTGRVRKERLGPVYPAATGIPVERLVHPEALIQVDFTASRHPLQAVNPGWEKYASLTYSPAVRAGRVLFLAGQAALDPASGQALFAGDLAAQADYIYANILAVLAAGGLGPDSLVKTVEYVLPEALAAYPRTAKVRARHLRQPYPAATGVVIPELLRPEFLIEVDSVAVQP
jgi:enamine deaminase RidA (YjgF/YER057c/UK114 family)